MKLKIEIDLENEAFDNNAGEEIKKCIGQFTWLENVLDKRDLFNFIGKTFTIKLYDTNGNYVGKAKVVK